MPNFKIAKHVVNTLSALRRYINKERIEYESCFFVSFTFAFLYMWYKMVKILFLTIHGHGNWLKLNWER